MTEKEIRVLVGYHKVEIHVISVVQFNIQHVVIKLRSTKLIAIDFEATATTYYGIQRKVIEDVLRILSRIPTSPK